MPKPMTHIPRYYSPIFHHDTHWFDRRLHSTLPMPLCQSFKAAEFIAPYFSDEENADLFGELHRPFEWTPFIEMFQFNGGSHSVRDYMPNCDTDYREAVQFCRAVLSTADFQFWICSSQRWAHFK